MSCIVARACTEVRPDDTGEGDARSRPLDAFRTVPAYVLLGDPGSGKSTSFEAERDALGEDACLVTARDFLALEPDAHPEWRGKTLFIDGLDEVRAGSGDARTQLDNLRGRLDAMGRPRFRLSCREADWLGANDRAVLATVSPELGLAVLRLDPLTFRDSEQILHAHVRIDDPSSFITTAREKGVGGLLANPQCLNMLARVVTSGEGWPESRLELFERSCRLLLREHNEGHIAATGWSSRLAVVSEDDLLDAAGRLCAVLLISGSAGCGISPRREDADYPDLGWCAGDHRERARQAIFTKLFKAVAEGQFQPIHRHVAEFLAGRYLARLIGDERRHGRSLRYGIPARRIVALIAGHDGSVVTELRGLSAWIAAHARSARSELLERDPIGVGLYGDIGDFSTREKRDLLVSLKQASSRLQLTSGATAAFESLATSAMQPAIEQILRDTGREPEHRSFVGFLLGVLCHGSMLPALADTLFVLVRDDTWSPDISELALTAYLHHSADSAEKTNRLKALLADVHAGIIPDPREELRGILLSSLYPQDVPPSEVWRYLTATEDTRVIGSCWQFWSQQIPDESSDEEVIELLDSLRRRFSDTRSALETCWYVRQTPTRLVARALDFRGDLIDIRHLYDWLSVGAVAVRDGRWEHEHHESARAVRLWLENRPDVRKALLMEGLSRCPASKDFSRKAFEVRNCLYGARRPPDYGLWCLRQAVHKTDAGPQVAQLLFWEAFRAHKDGEGNEGLSLDVLAAHVRQNEKLRPVWDLVTRPLSSPDEAAERRTHAAEQRQRDDEWLDHVRSNAPALNENRAKPGLLFRMACAYFGVDGNLGTEGGPRSVAQLLREDQDLTQAALAGLRGAIDRTDVPDIEETLDLRKRNQMHYLAWPFLAGLAESERTSSEDVSRWDEGRMRKALVFYSCYRIPNDSPRWYGQLLEKRPDLVADVLAAVAASGFRSDGSDSPVVWALAHDRSHARVAQLASLRLLAHFPTRCTAKQVRSLDLLLRAGLQYADKARLLDLVDSKLGRRSMNDAQRIRWLACGVLVAPERYDSRLGDFAEGRERRVRHLADFLFRDDPTPPWRPPLGKRGLRLFIGLLAPYSDPDSGSQSGVVTPTMWMIRRVSGMIGELAALPDEDVNGILEEMAAEPALSRWRPALVQAKEDQRVVCRDAAYRHPGIEEICRTLDNGTPANPADLAALTADRLDEIARGIRNDNANGWRPFWNEGEHRRPGTPKHEESCRDALLKELRHLLRGDADVQPEVRYADDKRADLRVSCRDFQIPIEIKKNGHPRLWSALRDQLIARYTRDPATEGYGIYLVLWFGERDRHRTPPPASGTRPAGPDALRQRLAAELTREEARKVSVCVIDVSAPLTKAR